MSRRWEKYHKRSEVFPSRIVRCEHCSRVLPASGNCHMCQSSIGIGDALAARIPNLFKHAGCGCESEQRRLNQLGPSSIDIEAEARNLVARSDEMPGLNLIPKRARLRTARKWLKAAVEEANRQQS